MSSGTCTDKTYMPMLSQFYRLLDFQALFYYGKNRIRGLDLVVDNSIIFQMNFK